MRILAVGPKIPYPLADGGRIGIYQPLKQLSARGHAVAYLGFGDGPAAQEFRQVADLAWARAVPHDTRTRVLGALRSIFSPVPYTVGKYRAREMMGALEEALREGHYDLVQLEGTHMALYLPTVRSAGLPAVLRLHNIEWVLADRFAETVHGPLRWFVTLQAARMKEFEGAACRAADLCLTVTAEDRARVRQLAPEARVAVMPAGVEMRRYDGYRGEAEDSRTIILLAAFDWPPNVDSARWFHEAIWPRVVESMPGARWMIVGKQPPASFYRWQRGEPSIRVTGYVDDVRPYLARAAVVVVPLRSGGGMRLKIPEAFAMRKAVLSTRLGAEGLAVQDGEHLLLADDEQEFANKVVRLLSSDSERARLGSTAHQWVASHLDWADIVARAESDYASLIGSSRNSAP
jgi:glycosyltransferase involved in cell wall biosynthesis